MAKYGDSKYGEKRYGLEPYITNRTSSDLKLKNPKAYMNAPDLTRIEAVDLIKKLHNFGYCPDLICKTWDISPGKGVPDSDDMERIRQNILRLTSGFYTYPNTPDVPENLKIMDIQKANTLELILLHLFYQAKYAERRMKRCGVYRCGEE